MRTAVRCGGLPSCIRCPITPLFQGPWRPLRASGPISGGDLEVRTLQAYFGGRSPAIRHFVIKTDRRPGELAKSRQPLRGGFPAAAGLPAQHPSKRFATAASARLRGRRLNGLENPDDRGRLTPPLRANSSSASRWSARVSLPPISRKPVPMAICRRSADYHAAKGAVGGTRAASPSLGSSWRVPRSSTSPSCRATSSMFGATVTLIGEDTEEEGRVADRQRHGSRCRSRPHLRSPRRWLVR